jgi:hypothetical protein
MSWMIWKHRNACTFAVLIRTLVSLSAISLMRVVSGLERAPPGWQLARLWAGMLCQFDQKVDWGYCSKPTTNQPTREKLERAADAAPI